MQADLYSNYTTLNPIGLTQPRILVKGKFESLFEYILSMNSSLLNVLCWWAWFWIYFVEKTCRYYWTYHYKSKPNYLHYCMSSRVNQPKNLNLKRKYNLVVGKWKKLSLSLSVAGLRQVNGCLLQALHCGTLSKNFKVYTFYLLFWKK